MKTTDHSKAPKSTTHESTKQPCPLDSENNCGGLQDGPTTPDANKHVENRRSDAGFCFEVRGIPFLRTHDQFWQRSETYFCFEVSQLGGTMLRCLC